MYKGTLVKRLLAFSARILQARREWHHVFKVLEEEKLLTKDMLLSKVVIQNARREKEFSRQAKVERIHHHQNSLTRTVKRTF